MQIPTQGERKWLQTNSGEVFGNLFGTKNIDFDQEGYAKLARRASGLYNGTTGSVTFGRVTSIQTLTGAEYYVMTSTKPIKVTLAPTITDATTFTSGGSLTGSDLYDGVIWQSKWYISQATTLSAYNQVAWTNSIGSLTTGKAHPLCVFEKSNYLAVGNGNTVKLLDTSHAEQEELTIPLEYEVRRILYNNANLYILTKNTTGGRAMMFVWNGEGTGAQYAFPVDAGWIFSGCVHNNSVVCMTSKGQLLRFNGGGFDVLANLPVYYTPYAWFNGSAGYSRVSPRGMVSDGEVVYINLDGYIPYVPNYLLNQPSGVWVYDSKVGLYHKASPSEDTIYVGSIASVDTSTNIFTSGTAYTAETGTRVFYRGGVAAGGLTLSKFYYLIRVTSTTFKLASTYSNAVAGTAIDITSSGTLDSIYTVDANDFGIANYNTSAAGAIQLISDLDTTVASKQESTGTQLIFGFGGITNDEYTADSWTIQVLSAGENRGVITTQKMYSTGVKDSWQKIITRFNKLIQGNDKVIIKYRVKDVSNFPVITQGGAVTWAGLHEFTTTEDLSSVSVGDEIEIINGAGSGCLTHVESITQSGTTWTVVTDENPVGITMGDKSDISIQNWRKIGTATSTNIDGVYDLAIGANPSRWIQFKIEIRGVSEPYIEELQIINQPQRLSA